MQGTVSQRLGMAPQPVEVDEDGQLRPQYGGIERLHEVVHGPRGVGLEAPLRRILAGDEDNRHVARLLAAPDSRRGFEAIHARKADVHQDRRHVRLVQEVAERLLAGCHGRQLGPEGFDHRADRLQRSGAVVNG